MPQYVALVEVTVKLLLRNDFFSNIYGLDHAFVRFVSSDLVTVTSYTAVCWFILKHF